MVVKSLGSWRQSIFPLRFQSPTVKATIKGARKWHKGPNQAAKRAAALQNNDLTGVATLFPQTNLPGTPSYTEGKTLKAKSEGYQDGVIPKGGTAFSS